MERETRQGRLEENEGMETELGFLFFLVLLISVLLRLASRARKQPHPTNRG